MRRTWVVVAAAVLVAPGCGGEDDPAEVGATDAPTAVATTQEPTGTDTGTGTATDTATAADGASAEVAVAETDLGEVLVDAEGMVLYMFDPDMQGESTCYDDCAQAWPPLVTDGEPTAGEGADDSALGVVERTDGAQQVTYGDWPLYYFAQDAAPGDTNGQGVNEVWWVLDADGEPVRD